MELPVVDISSKQVQPYMYEPVLVMSQQSEDDSLDSDDTAYQMMMDVSVRESAMIGILTDLRYFSYYSIIIAQSLQ